MSKKNKTICIVAGEASGDMLGAKLATNLLEEDSTISIVGMGGKQMQIAGVDILVSSDKLAVVGLIEVLKQFPSIRAAFKTLVHLFKTTAPDLLILIDYPGFNLRLAKQAKKHNIKVMYYVSPQIWAWHYSRIKTIKKYIDHMAVLFSFEKDMYDKENMPATFVGHPLVDQIKGPEDKTTICKQYGLLPSSPIIGLMPGSRHQEIERLMPTIIESVKRIQEKIPDAQFILPIAPSLNTSDIEPYLLPSIKLAEHNTHNILPLCDVIITASGTATLEIALYQIPLVIIYKVSPLTFWFGKRLIKLTHLGLCNLIAKEPVATELIQADANSEAISYEIIKLLQDKSYRETRLKQLKQIPLALGKKGASKRAAKVALEIVMR